MMPYRVLCKRWHYFDTLDQATRFCERVFRHTTVVVSIESNIPNREQLKALLDFAKENGRGWKGKLDALWLKAAAGPLLQQVRNEFGPSWLTKVTLKQLKAALEDTCT